MNATSKAKLVIPMTDAGSIRCGCLVSTTDAVGRTVPGSAKGDDGRYRHEAGQKSSQDCVMVVDCEVSSYDAQL